MTYHKFHKYELSDMHLSTYAKGTWRRHRIWASDRWQSRGKERHGPDDGLAHRSWGSTRPSRYLQLGLCVVRTAFGCSRSKILLHGSIIMMCRMQYDF
jgi:hypothetical protein